jgi:hypothetical protein
MAVALVIGASVYAIGSSDPAGVVLLTGCAVFAVWAGIYLVRALGGSGSFDDPPTDGPVGTMPDATRWTPVLALGLVLTANGLLAGTWLLLPGLFVTMVAVIRYAFEYDPPAPGSVPEPERPQLTEP